jgi:hypothetical protein
LYSGGWQLVRRSILEGCRGPTKAAASASKNLPHFGVGKLSASERQRRAKEIIEASGAGAVEHFEKVVRSNHGITFREQAEIWLELMKNRKRRPVAPSNHPLELD